jgi:hypothetical protein
MDFNSSQLAPSGIAMPNTGIAGIGKAAQSASAAALMSEPRYFLDVRPRPQHYASCRDVPDRNALARGPPPAAEPN